MLFDHDGVLVDTEPGTQSGERALADVGFTLEQEQYLRDMNSARALGPKPGRQASTSRIISHREVRNEYYQEFPRTEAIEIEGVVDALAELSKYVRMAIVTTAKREDFEIIHEMRQIRTFMELSLLAKTMHPRQAAPGAGPDRLDAPRSHQIITCSSRTHPED